LVVKKGVLSLQVRFTFLCDFAQDSGNGKINALGIGFDHFFVSNLGEPVPPFYLVINMEGNRSEAGPKRVEIHLMDSDGKPVTPPLQGDLILQAPPHGLKTGAGLILCYNQIIFPKYGSYSLSILVNGDELKNIPLEVSQPPNIN
jgi:hypothetical protein